MMIDFMVFLTLLFSFYDDGLRAISYASEISLYDHSESMDLLDNYLFNHSLEWWIEYFKIEWFLIRLPIYGLSLFSLYYLSWWYAVVFAIIVPFFYFRGFVLVQLRICQFNFFSIQHLKNMYFKSNGDFRKSVFWNFSKSQQDLCRLLLSGEHGDLFRFLWNKKFALTDWQLLLLFPESEVYFQSQKVKYLNVQKNLSQYQYKSQKTNHFSKIR